MGNERGGYRCCERVSAGRIEGIDLGVVRG